MEDKKTKSWEEHNRSIADLLKRRTGKDVAAWNARIGKQNFKDEKSLRAWLTEQGVTGYPQAMLTMERFGYPDFLTASADDLIEGQYKDRPALRPILDAVLAQVAHFGEVTVQARKSYVSLVAPRRTFATVEPTTKQRVDLGLRLAKPKVSRRLLRATSMRNSQVTARIEVATPGEVDDEVVSWLKRAYKENA
jgi:hypothetical protein